MLPDVPVPVDTPEIVKAEKANTRLLRFLVTFAVITFFASAALVWFRFSDQAKQSTTALAAKRSLVVAQRQDCRSEYNSRRQNVVESANSAARDSLAATMGYLLGLNSTADIEAAKKAADRANTRVAKLKSLPEMVDNGWTDSNGTRYPPCPVVR